MGVLGGASNEVEGPGMGITMVITSLSRIRIRQLNLTNKFLGLIPFGRTDMCEENPINAVQSRFVFFR